MFVKVGALIEAMDNEINYVKEARESGKSTQNYEDMMERKIKAKFNRLKEISHNMKVINKYDEIIKGLF